MKNKIIKLNIFMFIFFMLMLLTLGIDYATYFLNTNYLVSLIISLIINIPLGFFVLKKVELKSDFEKADLIFFVLLLGIFLITIVYPDRSFDTFNYHLYLQENPFGNKINYDFFAGKNLNSFTYAFPDRLFYLFRYFLGYRLGVILNYLLLTIIYYNVKSILKSILSKPNDIVTAVIATLITTSISLIDIVDSYYVDLVSLVLLLEIFRLIMNEKINDKNNTYLLAYLGLLFGFSFVCKVSNLFTLVVFFLIYVIKNRSIVKYINLKNILVTTITLLLPFILYLVYTYMKTGNPVFPFYNTIFHSKYFGDWNWLDTRFGPQRIRDIFIYPYLILFDASMACDISIVEPIWGYGYFVAIIYFIYYSYKKFIKKEKINTNRFILVLTTIIIYLVWAKFQLGYTRYGFITLILGSICTYMFIYDSVKLKKYLPLSIMVVLMLYNYSYVSSKYMYFEHDWIYDNMYNNTRKLSYDYNKQYLFESGYENHIDFEDGSIWGIFYYNAGLAQMINSDIPIVNITSGADGEYASKLLNEKIENATHIYTLVDSLDFNNFIQYLNEANFKIIDVKNVLTSTLIGKDNSFIYVFEVAKEKYENNFYIYDCEKEFDVNDKNTFETFIGIAKDNNNVYTKNIPVTIIGVKDGREDIIDKFDVDYKGNMKKISYDVTNYDSIKIVSLDKNNKVIQGNWFMNINVETK